MLDEQPHDHCRGMPSTCDQSAKRTSRSRVRIDMHGVRIVALGEFHNLLGAHMNFAELINHADVIVLKIPFGCWDHASIFTYSKSPGLLSMPRVGGAIHEANAPGSCTGFIRLSTKTLSPFVGNISSSRAAHCSSPSSLPS